MENIKDTLQKYMNEEIRIYKLELKNPKFNKERLQDIHLQQVFGATMFAQKLGGNFVELERMWENFVDEIYENVLDNI